MDSGYPLRQSEERNLGGFVGPDLVGQIRTATGSFNAGMLCLAGSLLAGGLLVLLIRPARS